MIDGVLTGLILFSIVLVVTLWQARALFGRVDRVSVGPYVIRLGLNDARAIACGEYISQLLGYKGVQDCLDQFRTGRHLINASLRQLLNAQINPENIWIQDAQGNSLNNRFQFSVQRTGSYVDLQLKPAEHKHLDITEAAQAAVANKVGEAAIEPSWPARTERFDIRQHAWCEQDFSIWLRTAFQGGIQPSYPFIIELNSGRLRIHDKLIEILGLDTGLRWINRYRWHSALPKPWRDRVIALPEDPARLEFQGDTFDLDTLGMSTLDLSTTEGELIRFRVTASPVSLPVKTFLFGHLTRIDYHPLRLTDTGKDPSMSSVTKASSNDLADTDQHHLLNQLAVIQGSTHQLSQRYAIADHDDYLNLIDQAIKDIRTQLVGDDVRVPQAGKNSEQTAYNEQRAALTDTVISIALVEDEPVVAEYLSGQIVSLGYLVTWYDGVSSLIDDMQAGRQFQVVITDWQLGDESGADLVAYLRENSFAGGVIACSATVLTTTFGIDCIMQKPIDPASFGAGLTTLVNRLFPAQKLADKGHQNPPGNNT
ncbi:MAG TPA: response regulator [Gammaproteobacteria bacterium]|nr:response regulator [Gammaproteobacteria bacterium]